MVRQDQVGRLGSVCPAGKTGVLMKEAEVEEWRKRVNYVVVIFVLFIPLLLCLLFVFRFKSVVRYFIFPPLHDPVLCSRAPKAAFCVSFRGVMLRWRRMEKVEGNSDNFEVENGRTENTKEGWRSFASPSPFRRCSCSLNSFPILSV